MQSIATRPADPATTLAQIGGWTLLRLRARDVIHDAPNGYLAFSVGPGVRFARRVVVRLLANDLYRVDITRLRQRTFDTIVEATATDLYSDALGETIERLYREVTS